LHVARLCFGIRAGARAGTGAIHRYGGAARRSAQKRSARTEIIVGDSISAVAQKFHPRRALRAERLQALRLRVTLHRS
jgi:hypothetical protein